MAEKEIDLGLCEMYCNQTQVYPTMKILVEERGMTKNAAGNKVEEITKGKVTSNRAQKVYNIRTPKKKKEKVSRTANSEKAPRTGTPDKPEKTHTKEDVKIPLVTIQAAIENDEISDEDLKTVVDAVSRKVSVGKVSTEVSSTVAAVHKLKTKKKTPPPEKPKKSLIMKVTEAFTTMQYNLESVLGKGKESITKGERKMITTAFMHGLPNFLRTLIWMGVDLDEALKRAKAQQAKELEDGKNSKDHPRLEK